MKKQFKCVDCPGAVRVTTTGPRTTWRGMLDDLPVPAGVPMLICDRCGAQYVSNDGNANALEEATRPVYEARLREMTAEALGKIEVRGVRAPTLERLLGLSDGYISRLRAGKTPSEALVLLLRLIAMNPVVKLREIERAWKRAEPKRAKKPVGASAHGHPRRRRVA